MYIFVLYIPAPSVLPVIHVKAVDRVCAGVHVVVRKPGPHGVLVQGRVWLGGGVVPRGQAAAGLTAIVTVTVIHSAVLIVQSCREQQGRL